MRCFIKCIQKVHVLQGLALLHTNPILADSTAGLATTATAFAAIEVSQLPFVSVCPSRQVYVRILVSVFRITALSQRWSSVNLCLLCSEQCSCNNKLLRPYPYALTSALVNVCRHSFAQDMKRSCSSSKHDIIVFAQQTILVCAL